MFLENSALLKQYEYLLTKIDELSVKQTTCLQTVFEDVFQDRLAAELVKMSDSKPHEICAEIDNAFTTVSLNKSANKVREFTMFNINFSEGLRQFILGVKGARKLLRDVYGHNVSDLEMIRKL